MKEEDYDDLHAPAQRHDDARRTTTNYHCVPDSGTDQLTGLADKMTIKIADGKHSYDFEYKLAETS